MPGKTSPKLTPALQDELCGYLERGHTIEGATGLVGIHRDTYFGWQERGNAARALRVQGNPVPRTELRYLAFADAVTLARNHGEGWLQEMALNAMANPKDFGRWQGYVTLLERTRPDRWRRRASAEYQKQPASPAPSVFTFDPTKLSDDDLAALEVLLTKAAPEED